MTAYIIRRTWQSLIVLVLVTFIVFLAMRLLPGDPILIFISNTQLEETPLEEINRLRHEFGLDKPLLQQYINWLYDVVRGDLGVSIIQRTPVIEQIKIRLPITLHLSLVAFILSFILGLPLGIIAATRRGTKLDSVVTILANIGITVPIFWLGVIMIYFFALYLGWLPVHGYTSPFIDLKQSIRQMIMPVICLTVFPLASISRQTRSSMLEVMRQDYIRTAWAKGLAERVVILKHALKNATIPVITLAGLSLSHVVGGSVLIETVFNIPGMGRALVMSVFGHDYTMVQGFVLIIAIFVLVVNFLVDISYGWIDPRIRYE